MDPVILVLITLAVGVVTVLFSLSRNKSDKAETDDQAERAPAVRNLNRPRANEPQIKFTLITSNACSSIPRQKTLANTADSIFFDEWNNSGPHRLESLKYGHLFDESSIERPKATPDLNEPSSYSQTIVTAIPLSYPITAQNTAIPLSVPTTSSETVMPISIPTTSSNTAIPLTVPSKSTSNSTIQLPQKNVLKNIINQVDIVIKNRCKNSSCKIKHKNDGEENEPKTKFFKKEKEEIEKDFVS